MELRGYPVVFGVVQLILRNEDTGSIEKYEWPNKVLQPFLNKIAQWIVGVNNTGSNAVDPPSQFMLGTGTGTPGTETSLFAPVATSKIKVGPRTYSNGAGLITINYPPGALVGTFTEAGLLDAEGVLLTHLMLSPSVSVASNQSATFLYTLTPQSA